MTILTLDPWKDPIPRESTQKMPYDCGTVIRHFYKKKKQMVTEAHTQGEKKYTQIVWIPFCNVYTNHIYIVKKML